MCNFVSSLTYLNNINRLDELGPILLPLIMLEEFDEALGNEIITSHCESIKSFMKWAKSILGISFKRDSAQFSQKPLEFVRKLIEYRFEASEGFALKDSKDLYGVVKWPLAKLQALITSYERAMIVISIVLVRARFGIKIDGDEDNDLETQILSLESSKNNYVLSIFTSGTGNTNDDETFKDIILKQKKTDIERLIRTSNNVNAVHFTIKHICNLIKYALFQIPKKENLGLMYSELGIPEFFRCLFSKNEVKRLTTAFLELVRYEEFEGIFGFVFDRYFKDFIDEGSKLRGLTIVIKAIQALQFISNCELALQLLECIDYDDERSTSSIILMFIDRIPWKRQQEIIKRVDQAYKRRGIMEYNVEEVLKLVPTPNVAFVTDGFSFEIILYSYETEAAFYEIFVDNNGQIGVFIDDILFFTPMYYENFNLYHTKSGFFIITHKHENLKESINFIIPYFKSIKTIESAMIILHELVRLFYMTRLHTFLNALNFYSGSFLTIKSQS